MSDKKFELSDRDIEQFADDFVDFLQDPSNKQEFMHQMLEAYRETEKKKFEQIKAFREAKQESDEQNSDGFHNSNNIAPLMHEAFNMNHTESTFARALKQTKNGLDTAIDHRVDEVKRLLDGIGGFSSQLKSCFARSTVVFFEQDDPKHNYRERLIFSIHLPSFELKGMWEDNGSESSPDEFGREPVQVTWDDAVNALASIIESVGLKAKYCKNDRKYGQFIMKQDLRSSAELPDEYFSLILDYANGDKVSEMQKAYNDVISGYKKKIDKLAKKLSKFSRRDFENPKYFGA
jgi:hypothetical protein